MDIVYILLANKKYVAVFKSKESAMKYQSDQMMKAYGFTLKWIDFGIGLWGAKYEKNIFEVCEQHVW